MYFSFGNLLSAWLSLIAGRLFKKIELNESIRYASGDPIESWLNSLLCLDVTNSVPTISRYQTFILLVAEQFSYIFTDSHSFCL